MRAKWTRSEAQHPPPGSHASGSSCLQRVEGCLQGLSPFCHHQSDDHIVPMEISISSQHRMHIKDHCEVFFFLLTGSLHFPGAYKSPGIYYTFWFDVSLFVKLSVIMLKTEGSHSLARRCD